MPKIAVDIYYRAGGGWSTEVYLDDRRVGGCTHHHKTREAAHQCGTREARRLRRIMEEDDRCQDDS